MVQIGSELVFPTHADEIILEFDRWLETEISAENETLRRVPKHAACYTSQNIRKRNVKEAFYRIVRGKVIFE